MEKFKNLEEAQAAFTAQAEELKATAKENKKLKADLEEKDQIIAEIRAAKTSKASNPEFTFERNTYSVNAKSASWNGKVITAEEICENKELQAELIEAGVGFIVAK